REPLSYGYSLGLRRPRRPPTGSSACCDRKERRMNRRTRRVFRTVFGTTRTCDETRAIVALVLFSICVFCVLGAVYSRVHEEDRDALTAHARIASTTQAAIERFWAIFHGNDYDAIPDVQAQLEAALRHDPNHATLYALLGATHFWHIGEFTRDPQPDPH